MRSKGLSVKSNTSVKKHFLEELQESIHYLNMAELKGLCYDLELSTLGLKLELIQRIITFLETGEVVKSPSLPDTSKAKKDSQYPLHPDTLILFGNYKNDAKTRQFFKNLIGEHFHFTAFGLDWTKERWRKGKPPTYAQFAAFWQQEYEKRKNKKASPKKEWAYLNFVQKYLGKTPDASRVEVTQEWEKERKKQVKKTMKILKEVTGGAG